MTRFKKGTRFIFTASFNKITVGKVYCCNAESFNENAPMYFDDSNVRRYPPDDNRSAYHTTEYKIIDFEFYYNQIKNETNTINRKTN